MVNGIIGVGDEKDVIGPRSHAGHGHVVQGRGVGCSRSQAARPLARNVRGRAAAEYRRRRQVNLVLPTAGGGEGAGVGHSPTQVQRGRIVGFNRTRRHGDAGDRQVRRRQRDGHGVDVACADAGNIDIVVLIGNDQQVAIPRSPGGQGQRTTVGVGALDGHAR